MPTINDPFVFNRRQCAFTSNVNMGREARQDGLNPKIISNEISGNTNASGGLRYSRRNAWWHPTLSTLECVTGRHCPPSSISQLALL